MSIKVVQERRAIYKQPAQTDCEDCGSTLSAFIHDLKEQEGADFCQDMNVNADILMVTANCPICKATVRFGFSRTVEKVYPVGPHDASCAE